jgi:glycosyltransferase involved in cell wall biosynthesis
VERFADVVVALDDGSSDRTRDLLERHPLVQRVIVNPPREGYAGWDDAENRNRLLEAAAELAPDWILSLDADERIDPSDAAALRSFVDRDALPGLAYGLRVHRMIGGLEHFDRADLWVFRLFAWERGQSFPERRLHFVPIPSSIPRSRWVRTSLRIQHLGSATEERRHARFAKYREADPERAFQGDYSHLLAEPGELTRWSARAPGEPVLPADASAADAGDAGERPLLSAIVIARDDEDRIERAVRSVVDQRTPHEFEVIVVTSGTDRTAAIVRERFPDVTLVELSRPALPGAARNAGLRLARGDYVSFPGSHVELAPGSLAARMEAHERGFGMVTGTTLNGTKTCAGWASYFLDHSTVLPGRPSEQLAGPPAHCSYGRHLLQFVGGFPEDMRAGEDTVVNRELAELQYRAWRERDVRLIHKSRCRTPWRLLRHHFTRGRGMGRILLDDRRSGKLTTTGMRRFMARYLPRRIGATTANVSRWGGSLERVYRLTLPLVVAAATAAWLGALYEIARPRARALAPVRRAAVEPAD